MTKTKPPKGGRKGGTIYPRISLKKAHEYAKKLVSKTHTGAQDASVILPGVFGNSGPDGKVRASALKQYSLLDGTPKAYTATDLARSLVSSTPEELASYLKSVFLQPKLFKKLFDTFQNDDVTKARIKQQASNLKVHPDSLEDCATLFVESAQYAGLATVDGEVVKISASPIKTETDTEGETDSEIDEVDVEENSDPGERSLDAESEADPANKSNNENLVEGTTQNLNRRNKPGNSNIDIRIDPSMDPEKLEKLLSVLRKYGQI